MKNYFIIFTFFPIFLFSQNKIKLGKYCSENKSNCITFLENNKYEQLFNFDVGVILVGNFYYDDNFLILVEDDKSNHTYSDKILNEDELGEIYKNEFQFSTNSSFTLFRIKKNNENQLKLNLMNSDIKQNIIYIKE